jgi:bacteriocin-like protein
MKNLQNELFSELNKDEMNSITGGGLWAGYHKTNLEIETCDGGIKTLYQKKNWFHLNWTTETKYFDD